MGRHQNQTVKRLRERNKKLKAEDKRAKRQKRKDGGARDTSAMGASEMAPRDEVDSSSPSADGAVAEPATALHHHEDTSTDSDRRSSP